MKTSYVVIPFLVVFVMSAAFVASAPAQQPAQKQESTGQYVDDSVITTKVKAELANDDFLKSFQISVETYKGIVQLSGFVDSQETINKAGQIAGGVKGVKSVRNNLIVKK
jgi:osmotically-inducible protein OsmY